MTDNEERYVAMMKFFEYFPSISRPPLSDIKELGDGITLFEALSEISQDYFDTSTIITHNIGDNWALKSNNLRKLLRNLETYYHDVLHKDTDFDKMSSSIMSIARNSNIDGIVSFIELIIVAAIYTNDDQRQNRKKIIGWIMNMSDVNQFHLKNVIESTLSRIKDYDEVEGNGEGEKDFCNETNHNEDIEEMDKSAEDDYFDGMVAVTEIRGFYRSTMETIKSVSTQCIDIGQILKSSYPSSVNTAPSAVIIQERDELRTDIKDKKLNFVSYKKDSEFMAEDAKSSQKNMYALKQDLQWQLEDKQNKLDEVEEELVLTKRILGDAEGRVSDLEEQNAILDDEMDVANAKLGQLKKSEAIVGLYREKLECVGKISEQLTNLENQTTDYVRKILDLEMKMKKVPELQNNLYTVQRHLSKVVKEKDDMEKRLQNKTTEVAKLKIAFSASDTAKRLYENEFKELTSSLKDLDISGDNSNICALKMDTSSLTNATVMKMTKKVMRLEIENNSLKHQLSTNRLVLTDGCGRNDAKTDVYNKGKRRKNRSLVSRVIRIVVHTYVRNKNSSTSNTRRFKGRIKNKAILRI